MIRYCRKALLFMLFLGIHAGKKPNPKGTYWKWDETVKYSFGGLKFGHGGKVYSYSQRTCRGGLFFKEPIELEFLCLDGYFLKRSVGCSSMNEEIVAGRDYVCIDYKTDRPKVQALISLTEEELPNEHTIVFYDDKEKLTNFRKYNLAWALRSIYNATTETGGPNMIVTNTHRTPEYQIGNICYQGVNKMNGAAFQMELVGEFKAKIGENRPLVDKTCANDAIRVELVKSGTRSLVTTGNPPIPKDKFKDETEAVSPTGDRGAQPGGGGTGEDYSEEGGGTETTTKENVVYIDIPNPDESEEESPPSGGKPPMNPDGKKPPTIIDIGNSLSPDEEEAEANSPDGENPDGTDEYDEDMSPDGGRIGGSGGNGTGPYGEPNPDFMYPINLKNTVQLSSSIRYLEPLFEENVILAIYCYEHIDNPVSNSNSTFLEIPQTAWFGFLHDSVEIVKKLNPDFLIPDQFFTDALKIFSFMFRNIEDDKTLLLDTDFTMIISYLQQCHEAVTEFSINTTDCPATFDYVTENDTQVKLDRTPPHANKFNSKSNDIIVESMWNVVDIIYTECIKHFEEDLGKHSRFILYLTETIFLADRVQARWYRNPETITVYESLLPYGDLEFIMYNYDKLKAVSHYNKVIDNWIKKPRSVISFNTHKEDNWNTQKRDMDDFLNAQNSVPDKTEYREGLKPVGIARVNRYQNKEPVNLFRQTNFIHDTEDWSMRRKKRQIAADSDEDSIEEDLERKRRIPTPEVVPWTNPKPITVEEAKITSWPGLNGYCIQLLKTPVKGYKQGTRIVQFGGLTPSIDDFTKSSMC